MASARQSGISCASPHGRLAAMALARKGGKTTSSPPAISERRHAEVLQVGEGAPGGAAQAGAHLLLVERARHLVDAAIEKVQGGRARRRRSRPSPDGCRWRRPAAIFASASFSQASYCAPPDGSQPRRSSVPEVELSTSALTFAGWAIAYSSIVQPPIDWPTRRTSAKLQMIDQRGEVAGIVGRIGAARRSASDGAKPRWAKATQV